MHEGFGFWVCNSLRRNWVRKHYFFSIVRLPFAVQDLFLYLEITQLSAPLKKGVSSKKVCVLLLWHLVVIGCLFYVRSMTAQTTCVTDSTPQV